MTKLAAKTNESMPASFIPNMGQMSSAARYIYKSKGNSAFLTADGLVMAIARNADGGHGVIADVLKIQFEGGDPAAAFTGLDPVDGITNYLMGNNPSVWITGVQTFKKVVWSAVYPGIDVVFYGSPDGLEFDFLLRPGARPDTIRMQFSGCDRLEQNAQGNLTIAVGGVSITLQKPNISQTKDGIRREISSGFRIISDKVAALELGAYDDCMELLIDPVIAFSTYLGGNEQAPGEGAYGVVVDKDGSTYVAGYTSALDFPVKNALQPTLRGTTNAFIAKFSNNGRKLVYSTYLGGSNVDFSSGIALDAQGNVYLSGYTSSTDFPVVNAFQSVLRGKQNAFVTKLNKAGNNIVYSTYLGGSAMDAANGIAVDSAGAVFVTGSTSSVDFPVRNAVQPVINGSINAFITRLSPAGNSLIYSTYLGGSLQDTGNSVALSRDGSAYITGFTDSPDMPVKNAFQPRLANAQGIRDAFVAKLNATGNSIDYCTYLGGSLDDFGSAIAVDSQGSAFVAGTTFSNDFPVLNALQPGLLGIANCFITRFAPDGKSLVFSTYLGGSGYDYGNAIALGTQGDIQVSGATTSANFPLQNALQPVYSGNTDAFISTLSADGSALKFSSFLGGTNADFSNAVTTSKHNTTIAGVSMSTDFPTKNPVQPSLIGSADAFVTQIDDGTDKAQLSIRMKASSDCVYVGHFLDYDLDVYNAGPGSASDVVVIDRLPYNSEFIHANPSIGIYRNLCGCLNWMIGDLDEGQSARCRLKVRIVGLGDAVNTANVYTKTNDGYVMHDHAVVVTKTMLCQPICNFEDECCSRSICIRGNCGSKIQITSTNCQSIEVTIINFGC